MNYPLWQIGFPGSLLIAIVAVLHVFFLHFTLCGRRWRLSCPAGAQGQSRERCRPAGIRAQALQVLRAADSGAGRGHRCRNLVHHRLNQPRSHVVTTSIHTYVWGWAIEWVFFFVEITAALIYVYGWDRWIGPRTCGSGGCISSRHGPACRINGIITYMLTPGRWMQNHEFWSGFFNPTY